MLKKLKRLIKTYFSRLKRKKEFNIRVGIVDEYHNNNTLIDIDRILKLETKAVDPKERLGIKYEIIANRTKSWRIRKKNIKKLVDLWSDIEWKN